MQPTVFHYDQSKDRPIDLGLVVCSLLRRSSILFRPEAPGLLDRMTMEITNSSRRMQLRDIFDAAPKEIAAKLNEYRDRALANPGTGSDQP